MDLAVGLVLAQPQPFDDGLGAEEQQHDRLERQQKLTKGGRVRGDPCLGFLSPDPPEIGRENVVGPEQQEAFVDHVLPQPVDLRRLAQHACERVFPPQVQAGGIGAGPSFGHLRVEHDGAGQGVPELVAWGELEIGIEPMVGHPLEHMVQSLDQRLVGVA